MNRRREGFALMAALWLVVIVGATGYELSVRSRARRLAVANALEATAARAAADAGLETARALLEEAVSHPLTVTTVSPNTTAGDPWSVLVWPTDTIELGDERVETTAYDAGSRLQLNRASEDDLRRLITALPADAGTADRLAQRIMDWRDADDSRRSRGAERADYLRSGARLLPSNAPFADIEELRDVDGMTPALYDRLSPQVTLLGTGQVNVNTASLPVLRSLPGLGDEAIAVLVRLQKSRRAVRSINELVSQLSPSASRAITEAGYELTQRMIFETREMVVVADGWVAGSPVRARGVALFTRTGDAVIASDRRLADR